MNLNNDDKYFEPVIKKIRISHYKKPHDSMESYRYDDRDTSSFMMMNPRLRENDDYFGYVCHCNFFLLQVFLCQARVTIIIHILL